MDSVLQYNVTYYEKVKKISRNPCFSGQCFAIMILFNGLLEIWIGRNPCFSGQCFAITYWTV